MLERLCLNFTESHKTWDYITIRAILFLNQPGQEAKSKENHRWNNETFLECTKTNSECCLKPLPNFTTWLNFGPEITKLWLNGKCLSNKLRKFLLKKNSCILFLPGYKKTQAIFTSTTNVKSYKTIGCWLYLKVNFPLISFVQQMGIMLKSYATTATSTAGLITKYKVNPSLTHAWPRQNFSLQYQYNIKGKSDERKVKNQFFLWDYQLIQYQIIQSNIMRIVWPTVRRITNEILGCTNVVSNLISIKKKNI